MTVSDDDVRYWIVIAVFLDVFVVLTNVLEISILVRKWRRLERIEHLLLSLSISDFLAGVMMLGQDITQLTYIASDGTPKMKKIEAAVLECLFLFSVLVSNFHILAIAVERLVAVVLPLKYHVFTSMKCKTLTISAVWFLSVVLSLTITGAIQASYNQHKRYNEVGYYITAGIFLFACVSVFSIYMMLACALIIREREMVELLPEEMHKLARDRKTTLFCLLIGFCYVVCILPFMLGQFSANLDHPVSHLLVTVNHALNPFIYFAKSFVEKKRRTETTTITRT